MRRSLGARPVHIAVQFLAESTTLGLLGGLIGTAGGVAIVLGVSLTQHWTALLQPWAVLPAPLIGALVGLVAGSTLRFEGHVSNQLRRYEDSHDDH